MANTRLATQLFNSRRPWSYGIIIIIFLAFLQLWSITTSRVDTVEYLAPPRPPTEKPGQKDEVLLSPRCKEVRQILENIRNKVKPSSNEQLAHKDGTVKTDDGNWWWVNRQPRPGCWTYEDRFGPYHTLSPVELAAMADINTCNAAAAAAGKASGRTKNAIILRTSEKEGFSDDVQLHAKALIIELGSIGWEIYHVIHLEKPDDESKTWVKKHVPEWMQGFTTTLRFDQAAALWPDKLKNFYEDNQASVTWFHKVHGPFDRTYVLEADIRYIGRWDEFIPSVDSDYAYYTSTHSNRRNLPTYPDFTTFELVAQVKPDWSWGGTLEPKYSYAMGRHSLGVIWGYSGKFLDTMDRALTERGSAYFETIVPTIANVFNLTTFQVAHTLYGRTKDFPMVSDRYAQIGPWDVSMHSEKGPQLQGGSYKHIGPQAEEWYVPWKNQTVKCRSAALIHPVKL